MEYKYSDAKIQISHGGRNLQLHVETMKGARELSATFTRVSLPASEKYVRMLSQLGRYTNTLSPQKQKEIFDLYEWANDVILQPGMTDKAVTLEIKQICEKMLSLIKYEEVRLWCITNETLYISADSFAKTFVHDENKPNRQEVTYIYDEYRDLLVLGICLRFMHPIWSAFVVQKKSSLGKEYKDWYMGAGLRNTWVMQNPVTEKLSEFVKFNAARYDESNLNNIESEISSVDICDSILYTCLVRKIPTFDNMEQVNEATLVASLYHVIKSKTTDVRQGTSNMVREKRDSAGPDSNDQPSSMESYKAVNAITAGTRASIEAYVEKSKFSFIYKLCKDSQKTKSQLKDFFNEVDATLSWYYSDNVVEPVHKSLVAHLYAWAQSPKAVEQVSRKTIITMMAVTQTVCWANGFNEMACVIGSWPSDNPDERARTSISKELSDELLLVYPFSFDRRAKKHSVVQAIESFYDDLAGTFRYVSLPESVKKDLGISGLYNTSYEFKNVLTQYVLYCAKLK